MVKYVSNNELREMEDSLVRKNDLYSRVDPFALRSARTDEEERFLARSCEIKRQVMSCSDFHFYFLS